eukprot:Gb_15811 [translate_table: standard]
MGLAAPPPHSASFNRLKFSKFKFQKHIRLFFFVDSPLYACVGQFHQITTAASASHKPEELAQGNDVDTLWKVVLNQQGTHVDTSTYVCLLQACNNTKALSQVQAHMFRTGFHKNNILETKLVSMYGMLGSVENARLVFDKMYKGNIVLWNAMLREYSRNGFCEEALTLYYQLQVTGVHPDRFTFLCVLKACSSIAALQEGKKIHIHVIRNGFDLDVFVETAFIDMYVKCGSLDFARKLFDEMSQRDGVSWNAMISGYAQNGYANEALALFHQMQLAGVTPDTVTMGSILQSCAHLGALHEGKLIHAYIIRSGLESGTSVGNSLVAMYAKCGSTDIAQKLFDKMSERNVVSWNAMIIGYAQNGHANEALILFERMRLTDDMPDSRTMVSVLQACANLGALQQGKWIHDYIIQRGFESNVYVVNSLVAMYGKCGSIVNARKLFDKMSKRSVASWNAMIAGYAQNGPAEEALTLFSQLQLTGTKPNLVSVVSVLSACCHLVALQQGMWIHGYMIRNGFDLDDVMGTALIDMYAKCGRLETACQLFDKMSKRDVLTDLAPSPVTMVSVVQACAHLAALQQAKWIHGCVIRRGFELDDVVGTALVDMYAKCGSIEIAQQLFNKMSKRNVVSWSAMITAYAQSGHANEALVCFNQMQLAGMKPNLVTMVSVLPACAYLASLQQGRWIHGHIIRSGFESDVVVMTALIDMYAKCGSIDVARKLFDNMPEKNVVSWNTMIAGYGTHGHGEDAIAIFTEMLQTGIKPNDISLLSVLSACSHAGLVDEGWHYFDCMIRDYCITPRMEHYACMVDLLGRAGHLNEAQDFIKNMPLEPGASVWGALLNACRMHCNIKLAGRWDCVAKVRATMKDKGLKKTPGWSLIEMEAEYLPITNMMWKRRMDCVPAGNIGDSEQSKKET